jgi:hypothetical protein
MVEEIEHYINVLLCNSEIPAFLDPKTKTIVSVSTNPKKSKIFEQYKKYFPEKSIALNLAVTTLERYLFYITKNKTNFTICGLIESILTPTSVTIKKIPQNDVQWIIELGVSLWDLIIYSTMLLIEINKKRYFFNGIKTLKINYNKTFRRLDEILKLISQRTGLKYETRDLEILINYFKIELENKDNELEILYYLIETVANLNRKMSSIRTEYSQPEIQIVGKTKSKHQPQVKKKTKIEYETECIVDKIIRAIKDSNLPPHIKPKIIQIIGEEYRGKVKVNLNEIFKIIFEECCGKGYGYNPKILSDLFERIKRTLLN